MEQILSLIWGGLPPQWRPFFAVGFCILCAFWLYSKFRSNQDDAEIKAERWNVERMTSLRDEIDDKGGRILTLEDKILSLHRSYQEIIDSARRAFEDEISRRAADGAIRDRDRDRGWNLARAWCSIAHDLWHQLSNALQRVPEARRPEMPDRLDPLEDLPEMTPDNLPPRYQAGSDLAELPALGLPQPETP